jgi:hypothetical protein
MEQYLIGAGAVLTAGPSASIAGASLHAQTDPRLAAQIRAAVIDFEGSSLADLRRLVVTAPGWTQARFQSDVIRPLLARGSCTLADVFAELARATGASEVHFFAHWLPGAELIDELAAAGIGVIAHPLDTIDQAALVTAQRLNRWRSPFRAA